MNKTKGIITVTLAAIIFGFTPILGKFSYLEGSNTLSLTFYRSFMSLPVIYAILKAKKIPMSVSKSELSKLTFLGILGPSLTALMLYGAYNYIPVGTTTTIHYIYPVLVTAVCIIFFKEKISREKIAAVVLSTIGISMFFEGDISQSTAGILLAIVSGCFYGAFIIFIDKSGVKGMHPLKFCFYTCVSSSAFLFIFGIITKSLVFHMTFAGWIYTFLVSIFVSIIANSLMQIGIRHVGSTITAIVGMFEPITSVIMGIIFLNEPFTLKNTIGSIFIIAAVSILTLAKETTTETNN